MKEAWWCEVNWTAGSGPWMWAGREGWGSAEGGGKKRNSGRERMRGRMIEKEGNKASSGAR
jgi:hypothetical protein